MSIRPRRSVLYMPGSNARALEKAKTLPADALILDLEDAVAPDAKEVARKQVAEAVAQGGYGRRELIVRINGLSTPWGKEDLAAAAKAGPDAVLIPKVSTPGDIMLAARELRERGEALQRVGVGTEQYARSRPGVEGAGQQQRVGALARADDDEPEPGHVGCGPRTGEQHLAALRRA